MERNDLEERLTWDTSLIYKEDEDFYKDIDESKDLAEQLRKYKGKITENADSLLDFLKDYENLMRKLYKAGVYASLKSDEDTRVSKYQEMTQTISIVDSEISQKLSFITPEILGEDYEKIKSLLEEKEELKVYDHYFEDLFRSKDHVLSEDQEKIIASFSKLRENPVTTYMIFSNADMKFPSVEKDGEEVSLSDANFTLLEEDKDRDFRRRVYETYYGVYKQFENTAASLLDGEITSHNIVSKLRGYDSARQMSLSVNNLDEEIYDNLLEVVHDNMDIHRNYTTLRKNFLGVDDLSLIHISEPTRRLMASRMPSSA